MPLEVIHQHINFVLDFVCNLEPQFKASFVKDYTEDGSDEAIHASLNDDSIVHVWKSAYIALAAKSGEIEVDTSDFAQFFASVDEPEQDVVAVDDDVAIELASAPTPKIITNLRNING